MEQAPLFEFETIHIHYERTRDHKLKVTTQTLTVLTHEGDAICSIYAESYKTHPRRNEMREKVLEAYHQRKTRPFGDEYFTDWGTVYYWTELV